MIEPKIGYVLFPQLVLTGHKKMLSTVVSEDYYKLLFAVIIYPVVSMRTNFATS